jgi:hypothetical protein
LSKTARRDKIELVATSADADAAGRGGAILITAGERVVGQNRPTFRSSAKAAAAVVLTARHVVADANHLEVLRR